MHEAAKERLSRSCETGLGIVLAVVPVALWVAWTPILWAIVVAVGVVAAALLIALDHRRGAEGASASPGEAAPALPDTFVATVHEIFPLTYHHSRDGSRRFRSAMEKLRRALD
ncbi:MAG TPA: hypothetical protein VGX52_00640 [Burkholderiales bacterium]|nr:hypothetical protein [Burkholderiales bacterium]